MKKVVVAGGLAVLVVVLNLGMQAEEKSDREGVKRAVLDYCEAFYEVKPELIRRSVHPSLDKYGFWRATPDEEWKRSPMNFNQAVALAERWNVDRDKVDTSSLKEVTVFDVQSKTACAKLRAKWGVDYFLLVKHGDKWMIERVLWQSLRKKG